MSRRLFTPVAVAGLAAAFAVTIWVQPWSDEGVSDMFVLRSDAIAFLDGRLPYRDVLFEYPPLAAPVIAAPGLAGTTGPAYRHGLVAMSLLLAVCMLLLVRALARRTGGDERLAMAGVAVSPLLLGATLRNHFDLAPTALTLAALLLVVRGRAVAGLALLGVAVATKGHPIAVVPIVLAWLVARGERRAAVRGFAAFAAVCAAALAVSVAISPSGAREALRIQTARPIQVESTPAAILNTFGDKPSATPSFRSDGIVHPAGGAVVAIVAALGAAALALLAIGAARGRDARSLVLAGLAATAVYAAFGKVLSPQYLVWTVPLMALALAWRQWVLAGTLALATLLTLFEFPTRYRELVARDSLTLGAVGLRDALLVAAVAVCIVTLGAVRRRAPPVPA